MSVDNHRHCQYTVISANGTENQNGSTWPVIDNLSGNDVNNLPSTWKSLYLGNSGNKANITYDFASTIKLINGTAGLINNTITGINGRLEIVEGKIGQLTTSSVTCYIAPNNDWYYANSDKTITNGTSTFIWHQDASDGNRVYYTRRNDASETVPEYSYSYDVNGEHRLYPGTDNNLELQYANFKTNEQKKYPVFSLNSAMSFLRRFRANGAIEYVARTQYGVYNYGLGAQTIRLLDAQAGSSLYIGPKQTDDQIRTLPCTKQNYTGFTSSNFQDSDVVKVQFVWSDNNNTHSYGVYRIYFYNSITTVEGIGFSLTRDRTLEQYNSIACETFMYIATQSGKITFKGCVFRNAYVGPSGAESPSPQIVMGQREFGSPNKYTTGTADVVQYNLNNIHYYVLPNVFVDDPPMAGVDVDKASIKTSYIGAGTADHTTIDLSYAFLVIRSRRNYTSPIRIQASDSLRWLVSWSSIGKFLLYYESESGDFSSLNDTYRSRVPIDLTTLTTARFSQSSIPSTAINQTADEQTRFEIVNKDISGNNLPSPSWLQSPRHCLSNIVTGYSPEQGSYNHLVSLFAYPGCMVYNGTAMTNDIRVIVRLNQQGGTEGTSSVYAYVGFPMIDITIPVKSGYRFMGYYSEQNGGGKQYYTASGKSANHWDISTDTIIYAYWQAS